MNEYIQLHREFAEELEVLLRKIGQASQSHDDFRTLQDAGLSEAISVFADELEGAIEKAREGSEG